MSDQSLLCQTMFEGGNETAWLELVSKALKGGTPDDLEQKLYSDVRIKPLYRKKELSEAQEEQDLSSLKNTDVQTANFHLPWDIRQTFSNPSPEVTNSEILRDLERGVSSVEIKLANKTVPGVHIHSLSDLEVALTGVDSSIAAVALDHQGYLGANASALLAKWANSPNANSHQKLVFNIDPTSVTTVPSSSKTAFQLVADLVKQFTEQFPVSSVLRSDARIIHEAGGSEVQELGALIASAIDTLRELDKHGVPPEISAKAMQFTVSVSANYGIESAKIRAARCLWHRCLNVLDIPNTTVMIQGVTSKRMLTQYDPWTNIIRNTCACFGAITGGCNIITVEPFTDALGVSSELGRRVARNTQIIAMEESNLGKVTDPVSGSWFVEDLTEEFANKGWEEFQRIESEGGYIQSRRDNRIQTRVKEVRRQRKESVATKREQIIGVNVFPSISEIRAPTTDESESPLVQGISDEGIKSLFPECATDDICVPKNLGLEPQRLASEFESIRREVDKYVVRSSQRPKIFVATLGRLSEFSMRLDFTRNFFAVAGIDIEVSQEGLSKDQLVTAWKYSGCKIVCLCGSDKHYEREAESLVEMLKNASADYVYLSGKFSCDGINKNIYLGQNAIEVLKSTVEALGILE